MKKTFLRALMSAAAVLCLGVLNVQADDSEFQLSESKVNFDGQGGTKVIKMIKAPKCEIFNKCDWMSYTQLKDGSIEITAKPYKLFYPRKTSIVLTSKKTNYSKVIEITQIDRGNRPARVEKPNVPGALFLTDMNIEKIKTGYGKAAFKGKAVEGASLNLKGSRYPDGVGMHAPGYICVRLNGATSFKGVIGIDDEVIEKDLTWGVAEYSIELDGKQVKKAGFALADPDAATVSVDTKGAKYMKIVFDPKGSNYGDHVDVCNAYFTYSGQKPELVTEEEMAAQIEAEAKAAAQAAQQKHACQNGCGQCPDKAGECKHNDGKCQQKAAAQQKVPAKKKPVARKKK